MNATTPATTTATTTGEQPAVAPIPLSVINTQQHHASSTLRGLGSSPRIQLGSSSPTMQSRHTISVSASATPTTTTVTPTSTTTTPTTTTTTTPATTTTTTTTTTSHSQQSRRGAAIYTDLDLSGEDEMAAASVEGSDGLSSEAWHQAAVAMRNATTPLAVLLGESKQNGGGGGGGGVSVSGSVILTPRSAGLDEPAVRRGKSMSFGEPVRGRTKDPRARHHTFRASTTSTDSLPETAPTSAEPTMQPVKWNKKSKSQQLLKMQMRLFDRINVLETNVENLSDAVERQADKQLIELSHFLTVFSKELDLKLTLREEEEMERRSRANLAEMEGQIRDMRGQMMEALYLNARKTELLHHKNKHIKHLEELLVQQGVLPPVFVQPHDSAEENCETAMSQYRFLQPDPRSLHSPTTTSPVNDKPLFDIAVVQNPSSLNSSNNDDDTYTHTLQIDATQPAAGIVSMNGPLFAHSVQPSHSQHAYQLQQLQQLQQLHQQSRITPDAFRTRAEAFYQTSNLSSSPPSSVPSISTTPPLPTTTTQSVTSSAPTPLTANATISPTLAATLRSGASLPSPRSRSGSDLSRRPVIVPMMSNSSSSSNLNAINDPKQPLDSSWSDDAALRSASTMSHRIGPGNRDYHRYSVIPQSTAGGSVSRSVTKQPRGNEKALAILGIDDPSDLKNGNSGGSSGAGAPTSPTLGDDQWRKRDFLTGQIGKKHKEKKLPKN
eukprot:TRINITY_DN2586_c0_g1_i2.p1 TRINITY_DN2586_c0_g1~~TRINITY_DN2586_c0_g1_i2.p1  ORF type:complete len:721 (+),score=212.04 TRINITY_DN2586_c0_g1_i2:47-2209(+)